MLVDDAGSDDTENYISQLSHSHPMLKYIRHRWQEGTPAARNTGLDNLSPSCTHVLFGEDDVLLQDDYCTKLLRNMEAFDCDIVGGRLLPIGPNETPDECIQRHDDLVSRMRSSGRLPPLIDEETIMGNWFFPDRVKNPLGLQPCCLSKRRVFRSLRFDKNYRFNYEREETDLWLRARKMGFQLLYAPECVAFHSIKKRGGRYAYGSHFPPAIVEIMNLVGLQTDVYCILNNRYFLEKFYKYLRTECAYRHGKEYYNCIYALRRLSRRVAELAFFISRRGSKSGDELVS